MGNLGSCEGFSGGSGPKKDLYFHLFLKCFKLRTALEFTLKEGSPKVLGTNPLWFTPGEKFPFLLGRFGII